MLLLNNVFDISICNHASTLSFYLLFTDSFPGISLRNVTPTCPCSHTSPREGKRKHRKQTTQNGTFATSDLW